MKPSLLLLILCWLVTGSCSAQTDQPFGIHPVFDNGAVWQRNQPIVLHGKASPGAEISFSSADLGTATGTAQPDSSWTLSLDPHSAGGPYTATLEARVKGGAVEKIMLSDIYLGDVYLISGQSNMEWQLSNTEQGASASAKTDRLLRHFKIPRLASQTPESDLPAIDWEYARPGKSEAFSAIGFYFAQALRAQYPDLPIGLINSTWGGSRIEAWLPNAPSLAMDGMVTAETRQRLADLQAAFPQAFAKTPRDLGPYGLDGIAVSVGTSWENAEFPAIDGTIWYDNSVELTDDEARQAALLSLGAIDDSDDTYVNTRKVGSTKAAWDQLRRYQLAPGSLQPGKNLISVRIEDTGGGGGMHSPTDSLYLQTAFRRIPLAEGWLGRPEQLIIDTLASAHHQPRLLFNAMVHPLAGLKLAGVLWYQGESNANNEAETSAYGRQLPELLAAFRQNSNQPDLPFFVVELPEWLPTYPENYQPNAHWAEMRQAQRSVLTQANTATVPALGYGDTQDIHPRRKQPVAAMLAEEAQRIIYGDSDGPRFSQAIEVSSQSRALVVRFDQVGDGLRTADGEPLRGFAVRGKDGRWYDADASITGTDRVRLIAPVGVEARAAAYAWSNNPDEANLINGWGRAVSSFRMSLDE